MSAPSAYMVHRSRGRLRLRVPEKKADAKFFGELQKRFEDADGVLGVETNPGTASVLVHLAGDAAPDEVLAAATGDLVALRETPPAPDTPVAALARAMTSAGSSVARSSGGSLDLRSLGFFALVGAAVYQIARGQILPAGGAMLISAIGLVAREAERQRA